MVLYGGLLQLFHGVVWWVTAIVSWCCMVGYCNCFMVLYGGLLQLFHGVVWWVTAIVSWCCMAANVVDYYNRHYTCYSMCGSGWSVASLPLCYSYGPT